MMDEVESLRMDAARLGYSLEGIGLLERAVRITDEAEDLDRGFEMRLDLMDHANFAGFPEKMVVAILWCIAQYEKNPSRFRSHNYELCWRMKWVLRSFSNFPNISLSKFHEIYLRFVDFWERIGYDMFPLAGIYRLFASDCGKEELAREYHEIYTSGERATLSDCAACVIDNDVTYLIDRQRFEEAIEMAAPVINRNLSCHEVPHRTFGTLLMPLIKTGRTEEAEKLHRTGSRLLRKENPLFQHVGYHLVYASRDQANFRRGLRLIEVHLPGVIDSQAHSEVFFFSLGAKKLFEACSNARKKTISLKLPLSHPNYKNDGKYEVDSLIDYFSGRVDHLAKLFDARNGNDHYSRVLIEASDY
ncbi:hypothetical protein K2Y11_14895 [bacterium]|nr:hypothetical protein [bacterium]